jgi:DNA polymerase III delta prime subunit
MIDVNNPDNFLWCEKYRPKNINECVLPKSLKNTFKDYISQGQLPHFLLCGTAGVGKTTVAKALCNEIGAEYIILNGSDTGGHIDTLRTQIKGFASTVSLTDASKIVIMDEADYLQANSTQPALRNFMEEFSANCRFIFTANYKNRIIEPLHSRCAVVEFKIDNKDKQQIAAEFFKRVTYILKNENVEFDPKVVAELITKYFPDYRRTLNELQRYSVSGKIDSGILINTTQESYTDLFKMMKDKDFTEVRKWVAKNLDTDSVALFQQLYDNSTTVLEQASIPSLILILADYQYKSAFVANHELNSMAALTEIMANCKFK